jgi:hypothetical protein
MNGRIVQGKAQIMPSTRELLIAATCAAALLPPALHLLGRVEWSSEVLWDLAAGSWLVVSLWIW